MSIGIAEVAEVLALQESLKEHRARLDDANERRRLSNRQSDYSEILVIVEAMVDDLTRASLRNLGETALSNMSTEESLRCLRVAITEKPDRFVEGAPTSFLAELVARQEQNLKDIDYLRRGFGLGSGRPKPADMKWDHAGALVSDTMNAFTRLVDSLRGEAAEIKRLIPESEVDFVSTRLGIISLLARNVGPSEFMGSVIDLGESQSRVAGWDAFRKLPYKAELEKRSSFFTEVASREAPARPLVGLYAGIAYLSRRGATVADLQLMGSDTYQVDDEDWFDDLNYSPLAGYAHSEVLAAIYSLAYSPGGLGSGADYTLCLAWASFFARECAQRYVNEARTDRIGCRVGFGGGDWIELGWIERD